MSDLGRVAQGEYPSRRSAYQARRRAYVWALADSSNVTQAAHSMGVLKRTRPVPCACAGQGRMRSAWRGSGVENRDEAGVGGTSRRACVSNSRDKCAPPCAARTSVATLVLPACYHLS